MSSPQAITFAVLSILGFIGSSRQQRRDLSINFKSIECSSLNSNICEVNCTITKNGNIDAISGYLNVLKSAPKGGISVEISGKSLNGDRYLTFLNQTVLDACPLTENNNRNSFIKIGIDELFKFGKIPKCPLEEDIYYLKDFYVSPEFIPSYLPEGSFRLKGSFHGLCGGKMEPCAKWSIKANIKRNKRNS